MPGTKATPDQAAQAVILREAGFTLPAIANELNISISTTQRLLKKHHVVAGASTQKLIEKAREGMLSAAFALDSVQQQAASLILDDLAISNQIRVKLAAALDVLDIADPIAFRALAASATTLKLTQDVGRRALPLDKVDQAMAIDELPELRIHIMTEADVAEMRVKQRLEEAERNGNLTSAEEELEALQWLESRRLMQPQSRGHEDDVVCEGFDSNLICS